MSQYEAKISDIIKEMIDTSAIQNKKLWENLKVKKNLGKYICSSSERHCLIICYMALLMVKKINNYILNDLWTRWMNKTQG